MTPDELLSELQEVKTRLFDELDQFLKLDHKTDFISALGRIKARIVRILYVLAGRCPGHRVAV